jgi:hypothetical protein
MPTDKISKHAYRDERLNPAEPHAVGGAVGAALGTAAGMAGIGAAELAAAGTIAGPAGVVAGAAIGAMVGGRIGKEFARMVNPTAEEEFWRESYSSRPYRIEGADYEAYRPAYRYGIDAFGRYESRRFDEIEPDLRAGWDTARGDSTLDWESARPAARDAYDRLHSRFTEEGKDV